jgi:hypothetical protein
LRGVHQKKAGGQQYAADNGRGDAKDLSHSKKGVQTTPSSYIARGPREEAFCVDSSPYKTKCEGPNNAEAVSREPPRGSARRGESL